MTDLARIETERAGDMTIARLYGEIDASNAELKGDELANAVGSTDRGLIVDLTGVRFLDSSAIGALFALVRMLEGRRQTLAVVMPESSPVRRALEIVQFERAAPLYPTVEMALTPGPSRLRGAGG